MIKTLTEMRKKAIIEKDETVKTALTLLLDKAQKLAKILKREMNDSDIQNAAISELKQSKESHETGVISADEHYQLERVYSIFAPVQLSEAEVIEIVELACTMDNPSMGSVMKAVKAEIGNQFDGKRLSEIVKKTLDAK